MALRTPEYLQTKTYSAMRDRLAFQHGGALQAGVFDSGDLKATQRAAGANMSVDVAAGFGAVAANDPGNAGLYHVQNDATVNVAILTNGSAWPVGNATNPRLDMLVLLVNDTTDGGDASDTPTLGVVQGTATAGATLDNRLGAAALPTGALLLADVLMPATSTTVVTANIRDRRQWARGLRTQIPATADTANATTSMTPITGMSARCELSGAPLLAIFSGAIRPSAANLGGNAQILIDGVVNSFFDTGIVSAASAGLSYSLTSSYLTSALSGSRVVSGAFASASAVSVTLVGAGVATSRIILTELPGQAANNT